MKTAVLYVRVSTDEQARSGYSLPFQKDVLEKYSAINNIEVLATFEDDASAKSFDRPGFQSMLSFCRKHKKTLNYVLFAKWDRFSRNATESLNMIQTLRSMDIEPQAIHQPIDFSIPQNKIMLAIYLMEPEVNTDVRSIATKEGLRKIKQLGGWVHAAPVGYRLKRTKENIPTLEPGERAPLIKEAFELMAENKYTQKEVRKMLSQKGLYMSESHFLKVLRNKLYLGYIHLDAYKHEPARDVRGLHPPIVSEELFYKVQYLLDTNGGYKGKMRKLHPSFPLRGHLTCNRCGGNLTGSFSRGRKFRYPYYHCRNGCKERFSAYDANEHFSEYLRLLKPAPEVVVLYKEIMQDVFQSREGNGEVQKKEINTKIKKVNEKLGRADELLIEGKLPSDRYKEATRKYRLQLHELEEEKKNLSVAKHNYHKYLDFGFHLVENLDVFYETASPELKHRFLGSTFPGKIIFENGKCRTPNLNPVISLFCRNSKVLNPDKKEKSPEEGDFFNLGTQERSRTFTSLRTLRPERSASTNSATWAVLQKNGVQI